MVGMFVSACDTVVSDTPDVLAPSIMVGDVIYVSTGEEVEITEDLDDITTRITSVVNVNKLPTQNNEANIGCLDTPYIIMEEGIAVLFDGTWILFK